DGHGHFTKAAKNLIPDFTLNGECVEVFDSDGDKDNDLFIGGRLTGGKYPLAASSKILTYESGHFVDKTKSLAPFLQSFGLVTDAVQNDIDQDGDVDLLVVGEWMSPTLLINNGTAGFTMQPVT